MKTKIKTQNILILLFTYLSGILSALLVVYKDLIPVDQILNLLNKQKQVEESIDIDELDSIQAPMIVSNEPEAEEVDTCATLIDIEGAIMHPGVYCFEKDTVIVDAVKKAGGFVTGTGYKYVAMNINLAKPLVDNTKIYIPFEEELTCDVVKFELPQKVEEVINPPIEEVEDGAASECININTASKDQLIELDGVGQSTAQKIIDARPYTTKEDILNVSGIGQATYDKFKDEICI